MINLVVLEDTSMPGWQIALIVLAATWGYCLGIGIVQRATGKEFDQAPVGLAWPFLAPYLIGEWIVHAITRPRIPKATVHKEPR